MTKHINIARFTLGLMWIYQGLVPKLFTIAPLEWQLSSSIGLSADATFWFIKLAGAGEVNFGLLLIKYYQSKPLLMLNILVLAGLLLVSAVLQPSLLVEAFNPVTTNIPCIALGVYLFSMATTKASLQQ